MKWSISGIWYRKWIVLYDFLWENTVLSLAVLCFPVLKQLYALMILHYFTSWASDTLETCGTAFLNWALLPHWYQKNHYCANTMILFFSSVTGNFDYVDGLQHYWIIHLSVFLSFEETLLLLWLMVLNITVGIKMCYNIIKRWIMFVRKSQKEHRILRLATVGSKGEWLKGVGTGNILANKTHPASLQCHLFLSPNHMIILMPPPLLVMHSLNRRTAM